MFLFGCGNRQRRSCRYRQWNNGDNTARGDSRNCTAYGEERERRTWDCRSDNRRTDNDSCDCDD